MKVNVDSWHYKVYDFHRNTFTGQLNLCSYIRGVARGFLEIAGLVFLGVFFGILVLELPVTWIMSLITGQFLSSGFFLTWINQDVGAMVLFSSVMTYAAGLILSIVISFIMLISQVYEIVVSTFKEMKELQTEMEPTGFTKLLVEYFKAIKEKTCPLVEREYKEKT